LRISKNATFLVTGGAGFIGSHIVDRLVQSGFQVRVIDNLSNGRLENVKVHQGKDNFFFIKGDIREMQFVKNAVKDVDVVFHEAALVGGPQSIEDPVLTNDINVNGTLNLLEASAKSDVRRFVLASSAAVYGPQEVIPIKEDSIPHPSSPYAVSKLTAELYAEAYHKNYGLETVCLRYFNVYGPRQMYGPYAAVITAFLTELIKGRAPTIYGDGIQTRDFVNVKDVVDANMLATEKNCAGEIINVAAGSAVNINSLFKILRTITGKSHVEPIYNKQRPFDVRQSCGDITRAYEILGFRSKVSLKEGLQELFEYYMKTVSAS
jgi:nucleoside-diphosphate-sugar epimerase